jgi:galactose mutarotase-like enzyme
VITEREVDGHRALVLAGPDGMEASFVPSAGMVGCSLLHQGEELLGQRGGLATYVAERSTMGIPLLHPWANRLSERRFTVAGGDVDLDLHPKLVSLDPNDLPIHGLLAGAPGWQVHRHEERPDGGVLEGSFDFGADPRLVAAFPFPHELRIRAVLSGDTLRISTVLRATGDTAVPVSFGYHPYLRIPGVPREQWGIEIPVMEGLELDEEMLPTGRHEPSVIEPGPLTERTFDDAFVAPQAPAKMEVSGGGRRIAVAFESGYPYAQVYAPMDDPVIALEPMTAPENALVSGAGLPIVPPGESYEAVFSIRVTG